MGNEEWGMRNGECGMGSEEWENEMGIQIGNGKWEFFLIYCL